MSTDTVFPDVPLGDERHVRAREVQPGQYVFRRFADGWPAGWFRVVETTWQPAPRSRYYIRFDRPPTLANRLPDHYYLTPRDTESVRDPIDPEDPS